jgi:hypothetical protein
MNKGLLPTPPAANNTAMNKALLPIIITRFIVGFVYGAVIWSGLEGSDYEESPLISSLGCILWGALGILASSACAEIGPRPISDVIVIAALTYSGYQKFIK